MSLTTRSSQRFAAVHVKKRIVAPLTKPFNAAVVVSDVVVPPVAVIELLHLDLAHVAPAPNVPANASEGI